jgi:hypothetical protein
VGGFLAGHDDHARRGVRRIVDELLSRAFCPENKDWGDVWVHAE